MSKPAAHVQSIEALRQFRLALVEFQHQVQEAVTSMSLEVRRAVDWIEQDRTLYWPQEVRHAGDRLAEARTELERCEATTRPEDRPGCTLQRRALEQAKARLRLCEEKIQAVRRWKIKLRHESQQFGGRLSSLRDHVDIEMPRAMTVLERMITALEHYAQPTSQNPES